MADAPVRGMTTGSSRIRNPDPDKIADAGTQPPAQVSDTDNALEAQTKDNAKADDAVAVDRTSEDADPGARAADNSSGNLVTLISRLDHPVTLDLRGKETLVIPPRGRVPNVDPATLKGKTDDDGKTILPRGVQQVPNTGRKK